MGKSAACIAGLTGNWKANAYDVAGVGASSGGERVCESIVQIGGLAEVQG